MSPFEPDGSLFLSDLQSMDSRVAVLERAFAALQLGATGGGGLQPPAPPPVTPGPQSLPLPSAPVLDNFNRANGAPGANWNVAAGAFAILTNQLQATSIGRLLWTALQPSDCQVYYTNASGDVYYELYIRCTDTTGTVGYYVGYDGFGSTNVSLYRLDVGGSTTLLAAANLTAAMAVGDVFGVDATGGVLTVFWQPGGTGLARVVCQATDATYQAAGYIGVGFGGNHLLDNFGGSAQVAPAGATIFDASFDANTNGVITPFQALEFGGTGKASPTPAQRVQFDAVTRNSIGQSVKCIVQPGDQYFATTGERCILRGDLNQYAGQAPSAPPNILEGDDLWFGTTLMLDTWFPVTGYSSWWELHQGSNYVQASLKLYIWPGQNQILLETYAGYTPSPTGPWAARFNYTTGRSVLIGSWYDVRWHVHFSSGATGALTLWLREKTESWPAQPTIAYSGPTLPTGNGVSINYPQLGYYRPAAAGTTIMRFNHYRIATSQALIDQIWAL